MKEVEVNFTFREVEDFYVNEKYASGLSKSTMKIIDNTLKDFKKLSYLDETDYISIVSKDFLNKYICEMKARDYSLVHINMNLCHLRTFLYWCMNEGYIKEFKVKMIKGQQTEPKQIKDDDMQKLLMKPNNSYWEQGAYAIVIFLLSTGCRASTLLNIRVEDLDFKNKTIYYDHLKNKKYAIIPMSTTLSKTILTFSRRYNLSQYKYLFCTNNGEQMSLNRLEKEVARWCKRCGVPRYGPHCFRRYFARQYVKKGGNLFSLQQFLTHSSLDMTRHYVQLNTDDLRIDLDKYVTI